MANLTYIVGDTLGGASAQSQSFWPEGRQFDMTVFERGKSVRSADLNLIQMDLWMKLRDHVNALVTSGWESVPAFGAGNITQSGVLGALPANTIVAPEAWFNMEGRSYHVGNPDSLYGELPNGAAVTLPSPPGSGSRTDYVYVEFWVQEVAAVGSTDTGGGTDVDRNVYKWGGIANGTYTNDFWWGSPANEEPIRRLQLRWRFVTVSDANFTHAHGRGGAGSASSYAFAAKETFNDPNNVSVTAVYVAGDGTLTAAQAMNTVDGYVYMTPLVAVTRHASVTAIAANDLTDLRVRLQLQPGIVVNATNIYPAIQNDLTLEHNPAVVILYQGSALGSNTVGAGVNSGAADLSAASYATRFVCPNLSAGNIAELQGQTTYALSRVSFNLGKVGTGADVQVELRTDSGGSPGALVDTATIPASWLTTSARDISLPFTNPSTTVHAGSTYWLVVKQAGSGGNHPTLTVASTVSGSGSFLSNGSGSWANSGTFNFGAFTGSAGNPVFVLEDANDLSYFEYDTQDNITAIGEYYTPSPPLTRRDSYRLVSTNPTTGNITAIT